MTVNENVPGRTADGFLVVELRTHGVSGTPPASILGAKSVVQINPGRHGRFFQEAEPTNPEEANPYQHPITFGEVPHDRLREAYHWGSMTSGGFMQAMWALLLPFALVNVAQWMLPAPTGTKTAKLVTMARALIRIIGLLLTALISAQLTVIVADLFFAQCLSATVPSPQSSACWSSESIAGHLPSWLERWTPAKLVIADIPDALRAHPLAGALVIAAVVTAAVVVCGTMTGAKYAKTLGFEEDPTADVAASAEPLPAVDAPDAIGRAEFRATSSESETAPALRTLHTVAAFCSAALLLLGMWRWSGHNAETYLWGAAVALSLLALVCGAALDDPTLSGGRYSGYHQLAQKFLSGKPGWILSALAFGVFVGVCALVVPGRLDRSEFGVSLAGVNDGVSLLMITLCGACLLLLVLVLPAGVGQWRFQKEVIWESDPESGDRVPVKFRAMLFGVHAPFVASLACLLGAGLGAGLAEIVAHFLVQNDEKVRLPGIYQAVALLWGVMACGLAILAICALVVLNLRLEFSRLYRDAQILQFGDTPLSLGETVKFGSRWFLSRINQSLHRIVAYMVVLGVLGGIVSIYTADNLPAWLYSLRDRLIGWFVEPAAELARHWDRLGDADWAKWQGVLEGVGLAVIGFLVVTLLRSIMNARKNPDKSGRNLGVIWDIVSFWPREAHPVTPMSYAPRALDDLVGRIYHHLEWNPKSETFSNGTAPNTRIVLCGHSQGSLLMYAAVLQIDRELVEHENRAAILERIGLMTYGSQLQWAFARGFPSMLSFESHARVMKSLGGKWHNLIRFTDFVGGPVLSWKRVPEGATSMRATVLVDGDDSTPPNNPVYQKCAPKSPENGHLRLGNEHWFADPAPSSTEMLGHSNYMASAHWDSVLGECVRRTIPTAAEVQNSEA
ncbi:hypothetical protein D8W71_06955 [Rhodococcus sp. P1Y]|nr:hypothetical protein D8W71_06955 [Rhodococcus sp. P1Y]